MYMYVAVWCIPGFLLEWKSAVQHHTFYFPLMWYKERMQQNLKIFWSFDNDHSTLPFWGEPCIHHDWCLVLPIPFPLSPFSSPLSPLSSSPTFPSPPPRVNPTAVLDFLWACLHKPVLWQGCVRKEAVENANLCMVSRLFSFSLSLSFPPFLPPFLPPSLLPSLPHLKISGSYPGYWWDWTGAESATGQMFTGLHSHWSLPVSGCQGAQIGQLWQAQSRSVNWITVQICSSVISFHTCNPFPNEWEDLSQDWTNVFPIRVLNLCMQVDAPVIYMCNINV